MQTTLLGELLEHAKVGAVATDGGRCVAANQYACELTGYARAELIGRPLEELCRRKGNGVLTIGAKEGEPVEVSYRVVESELAGISVKLSLFWPA